MLPVPVATAETEPFWEGCRKGELRFQRCSVCGTVQLYPKFACVHCQSQALEWHRSCSLGTVEAATVVHRAPIAAYRALVPYWLVLATMDEGFRLLLNMADGEPVAVGDRVRVVFEQRGDMALPQGERL